MKDLNAYLKKAEQYHGHICSGQILGIRMMLLGLKLLNLDPDGDLRDLMIYLETDRCVADAAHVVTGITVGQRRIKMNSFGKTALSLLDLGSGKAVRVSVKTSDRPPHHSSKEEQLAFWEQYKDEDIFKCEDVVIEVGEGELPGPPVRIAVCAECGEDVLDCRDVAKDGETYCRACAGGAYYRPLAAK